MQKGYPCPFHLFLCFSNQATNLPSFQCTMNIFICLKILLKQGIKYLIAVFPSLDEDNLIQVFFRVKRSQEHKANGGFLQHPGVVQLAGGVQTPTPSSGSSGSAVSAGSKTRKCPFLLTCKHIAFFGVFHLFKKVKKIQHFLGFIVNSCVTFPETQETIELVLG